MQRRAVQCRGFCFWFWVLGLGVGLGTAGTGSTGAGTPAVSSDTALVATEKHHPGFYPQWHGSRPRKTSPMMRQASWSFPTSFVRLRSAMEKVNIAILRRPFGFRSVGKVGFPAKVCHVRTGHFRGLGASGGGRLAQKKKGCGTRSRRSTRCSQQGPALWSRGRRCCC